MKILITSGNYGSAPASRRNLAKFDDDMVPEIQMRSATSEQYKPWQRPEATTVHWLSVEVNN